MSPWLQHLPVMPIVVPLLAGSLLLLLADSRRALRVGISLGAMLLQFATALMLLYLTSDSIAQLWPQGVGVYMIGNWAAPFGIVLVVDRLTALMLILSASVALASLVYSLARCDRLGPHFHSLFQFLLMGLNGAFLTGDLFNLFVFFEVLLAASYGLVLHGSGKPRVKAGLHYIVVNLASSLLFLIGVALIYGITGTLNMADLAGRIAVLTPQDRPLFEAGAAVLAVSFLVKSGSWPLNFWLPGTYAAAGAPVAAVFSLMTKVGIYALIRIGTLIAASDPAATFIGMTLFYVGMATLVAGTIGLLAAQHLGRLVGFSVIVSSGTLLAAVGFSSEQLMASALFYMLISVLASSAFFILTGMTERTRTQLPATMDTTPPPALRYEAFGVRDSPDPYSLDEEVGIAIPAVMAFLGLSFVCCVLLISGLPPLSGFLAKFALLSAIFNTGFESAPVQTWSFIAAIIVTGFAALIALTRVGMRLFWTNVTRRTPRLRIIEAAPVAFLLLLTMGLTIVTDPVMTYLDSTARALHDPEVYIRMVLSSRPSPAMPGLEQQ